MIEPGLRVLVVEDEGLIALEIETLLKEMGCVVFGPAPTVARALALIAQEEADFALLDVNLGGTRSTPVAEALRERGMPYALITGYDADQLPEPALGGIPYLGKPIDYRALERLLTEIPRRRER
jgi:DNA-binding response OmpR family regulator